MSETTPRLSSIPHAVIDEALTPHIEAGVALLLKRQGLAAYEHFQHSVVAGGREIRADLGTIIPIRSLTNEAELMRAAGMVAQHSRTEGFSAEIGGWHTGDFRPDFADDTKYLPQYVDRFHMEVGTVAAEEWLHMLQKARNQPLAGHNDPEVDVAAHLHKEGVDLSIDYLTRYANRAAWYADLYPEHTKELHDFAKQFGRYAIALS